MSIHPQQAIIWRKLKHPEKVRILVLGLVTETCIKGDNISLFMSY